MKPKRETKDVVRDINQLNLQYMNGSLSRREYERRRSVLDAEWKIPATPNVYTGVDYANGLVTSINVVADSSGRIYASDSTKKINWTKEMNEFDWEQLRKEYLSNALGRYSGSLSAYSQLAKSVWDECEGVVLCECESMDCLRRIDITKEEYIQASSPGNACLTHPECSYGIVNSRLIHRTPKWNIWRKGDMPGW